MQWMDRNCTSSSMRGAWPAASAAPALIQEGMDEEGGGGGGRTDGEEGPVVEGGGAAVVAEAVVVDRADVVAGGRHAAVEVELQ